MKIKMAVLCSFLYLILFVGIASSDDKIPIFLGISKGNIKGYYPSRNITHVEAWTNVAHFGKFVISNEYNNDYPKFLLYMSGRFANHAIEYAKDTCLKGKYKYYKYYGVSNFTVDIINENDSLILKVETDVVCAN